MLKYYKTKQDFEQGLAPKGVINFNQVCVNYTFSEKDIKIELQIKGCDRRFLLKAQDLNSWRLWKHKLSYSIERSSGKKRDLGMIKYTSDINQMFEFWRFLRIHEQLMIQQAEVGDIILCFP